MAEPAPSERTVQCDQNAIIFHGTGADPEAVWYPWLGRRLDVTVAPAILVAGYCTQPNSSDEPVLQDCYD
jgi:hypothetical protein